MTTLPLLILGTFPSFPSFPPSPQLADMERTEKIPATQRQDGIHCFGTTTHGAGICLAHSHRSAVAGSRMACHCSCDAMVQTEITQTDTQPEPHLPEMRKRDQKSRMWTRWWTRSWLCRSGQRSSFWAPVVRGRKGEHVKIFEQARKSGYVRVRVDGNLYELSEEIKLEKNKKAQHRDPGGPPCREAGHRKTTDRFPGKCSEAGRRLAMVDVQDGEMLQFSQSFSCPDCGISIDEIEPRSFSFNNPFGACPDCYGLGYKMEFD